MPELFDRFLFGEEASRSINSRRFYKDSYNQESGSELGVHSRVPFEIASRLRTQLSAEMSYLNEYDTCAYCDTQYRRGANVGTHRCRFHPNPGYGPLNECCQRAKGAIGCVGCDHKPVRPDSGSRWLPETSTMAVPLYLLDCFEFPTSSIERSFENHNDPAKSYVVVQRVGAMRPAPDYHYRGAFH